MLHAIIYEALDGKNVNVEVTVGRQGVTFKPSRPIVAADSYEFAGFLMDALIHSVDVLPKETENVHIVATVKGFKGEKTVTV